MDHIEHLTYGVNTQNTTAAIQLQYKIKLYLLENARKNNYASERKRNEKNACLF